MPFSDLFRLFGTTPLVPTGSAGAPGATPPFLPTSSAPIAPPGVGDPGVDPAATMGDMPTKQGLLSRLLAGAFPVSDASGLTTPEQQRAAQQQGLLGFGTSLLANSGAQPGPRRGLASLVGQALQDGQGRAQGGINEQLQQLLLKSRIAENQRQSAAGAQDPALVAEYNAAKADGYAGSLIDFIKLKQPPAQKPSALQELEYLRTASPEERDLYFRVKRSQETPFRAAEQAGASGAIDQRTGAFIPQASPEQNQAAAAALKAAEAGGSATGKAEGERAATFQQDLNVIDDEITRTSRLLGEFKGGMYQTGPVAGRLPNIRDAAQNLAREQGRDVLKNISQATFGALSEGEREFLKGIGIDPNKNEGSNITYLEEKLTALQKAKQRLISRPPLDAPRQSRGATSSFAPQSSGRAPLSSFRR